MNVSILIDIDDELSLLWSRLYGCIVNIASSNLLIGTPVLLDGVFVKSVIVSSDGCLSFTDNDGNTDIAEQFDDCVMYDAYKCMTKMFG
ncbi:MAG: hypothetical protein II951_03430 [Bacteroidales bacterium]|nr:hypothetical protein [Bacteroidales bacterium]